MQFILAVAALVFVWSLIAGWCFAHAADVDLGLDDHHAAGKRSSLLDRIVPI